jgi:ABC-2 type transport system permease protein
VIRWRPTLLVTSREIRERMRGWAFRLSTLAIILFSAGGIVARDVIPGLIDQTSEVGVVTADAPAGIEQAIRDSARDLDENVRVRSYNDAESAEQALREGDIDAYLAGDTLVFESGESSSLAAVVNRALYTARLPEVLRQLNLTPQEAQPLVSPQGATLRSLEPSDDDNQDVRAAIAALAAVGLYLTLVLYGSWTLTGVAEEKSSRVVEVLLGLLQAEELLAGKTLGILVTAAVQLICALLAAIIGLMVVGEAHIPDLAGDMVAVTATFFILGVLLYSLLYAAFGATISRQSDAQTAAMPVTFILLVPYLASLTLIPANPDGVLSHVLGVFPLSSPLVMPSLVALGVASAWEVALSILLLFPALALVAWVGGKIYTGAILSNRRTSLRQLLRPAGLRDLLSR